MFFLFQVQELFMNEHFYWECATVPFQKRHLPICLWYPEWRFQKIPMQENRPKKRATEMKCLKNYKLLQVGNIYSQTSQCPRADLNKKFLPRPKTTTAWKCIPHRSKISKNWNPPYWDPLHRFFKNLFLLIQKLLYNNYIQTHFT